MCAFKAGLWSANKIAGEEEAHHTGDSTTADKFWLFEVWSYFKYWGLNSFTIYVYVFGTTYFFTAHLSLNQQSTRDILGAAAEEELRKGNTVPNELLVNIIVEAIR